MAKPIAVCDRAYITPEHIAALEAAGYVVLVLDHIFGRIPPVYVAQSNDAEWPKVKRDIQP